MISPYLAFFRTLSVDKIEQYFRLMRFDKPIGILLLLWPTYWALWLSAGGFPKIHNFLIFSLGVILMRSAGCIINDYADRNFDGKVARTKNRPIATGAVRPEEAITLFVLLMLFAFLLVLLLDALVVKLAFVGAGLTILYPFAKRFTWFPQVLLGATFGWCVPMAFAAESGNLNELTWLLYFTNLIWIVAYDTQYAMVDREDDLKLGLRSTAILFGDADRLLIGIMQGMVILGLIIIGANLELHGLFFGSVFIATLLFGYQQWLIRKRQPKGCFQAFLNNNWVGFVLFLGIMLDYLLN